MPYEIDDDLLQDIESGAADAWQQHGSGSTIDTEALSNEELAYLSTNPEYLSAIMGDLGIDNPDDYTQFISAYDPWKEDIAGKKWTLGKDKLMSDTRKGLLDALGDPLQTTTYAAKSGFEGMGQDQGGYLKTLQDIDVQGAENRFRQDLQGTTLARDEAIEGARQDYSDMLYRDIGDIYAQQEQAKACFRAGTKIETPNGKKNIEDIIAGDTVKAYDEKKKKFVYKKVYETHIHLNNKDGLVINGECKTTDNHPFYTIDGEWLSAGELKIGHKILDKNGSFKEIKVIEKDNKPYTVYNFEVRNVHTYLADGYLVHNGGGGKGGK